MIDKISEYIDEHMEIVGIAVFILIFTMFVGGVVWSVKAEQEAWNDGYCECGGKWEYVSSEQNVHGVDGDVHTTTHYIYRCDECGKMEKFSELR